MRLPRLISRPAQGEITKEMFTSRLLVKRKMMPGDLFQVSGMVNITLIDYSMKHLGPNK